MSKPREFKIPPTVRSYRIVAVTGVLFILIGTAQAATLTVGFGAGYDYGTIQRAIDAASNGDTIVVAQEHYKETINFRGRNITLTSADPNSETKPALEPAQIKNPVVIFSGREGPQCVLRGLLISHAWSASGIQGNGTKATISDCIIDTNRSDSVGGGIWDCDGLIQRCTITDNGASRDNACGGGLYDCDGHILNCTISANYCGQFGEHVGAGAGLHSCDGIIEKCTISGNYAAGDGGGLYNCNGTIVDCDISDNVAGNETLPGNGGGLSNCNASVSGCRIIGNTAAGYGGGLCDCNGLVTGCTISDNEATGWHGGGAARCDSITTCMISSNRARGYGGGLFACKRVSNCTIHANRTEVFPGGGLSQCDSVANCMVTGNVSGAGGGGVDECNRVINCTMAGNRAAGDGGGLSQCHEVYNCTVVGNLAIGKGGAVYYQGYFSKIINCIIWDNSSAGGGIYAAYSYQPQSQGPYWSFVLAYNDIQGGREAVITEPGCQVLWDLGNLDEAPRFIKPGRWSGQTAWEAGEYHLLPASPCIDAGDPNGEYSAQTDIDGESRVFGDRVDIGADECRTDRAFLMDLTISGPNDVAARSSAQFRATACYTNEFTLDVTQSAIWSVEPNDLAAIDGSGMLILQASYKPAEIVVRAQYTDGAIAVEAKKVVKRVPLPPPVVYYVDGANGKDENNGLSRASAFATIHRGIDAAVEGDTILVCPGVYTEEVRFKGKGITLRSADEAAILENPGDFAVSFYYGEGPGTVLKNFVIRKSLTGIFLAASSPTISNVTVVDDDFGVEAYAGAAPDIRNCIFWNNEIANLVGCAARYSCLQQNDAGPTNINRDPLFADPDRGDYHLRSTRGRYWPEYEVWVLDEVSSPCIDAGDPNSPIGEEPSPNGGRINMGAHGGTSKASLSASPRR
jgi:hypothetical protein